MSIEKSTKAARGTVQCKNTNINQISALNGEGIDEWCDWLLKKVKEKQNA